MSPLLRLHLRWRKFRGREHPVRWRERLACPSALRPTGHLVWFHAVSLGEGLAAIPVIKCCLERRPDVTVLMTTTTTSAFEVIKTRLPSNVIYQFAPLDIPSTVDAFLQYWRPSAVILMESELWPNLIVSAARYHIALILLNGRMSAKSFQNWSQPAVRPLIMLMLSKFSLILPLSAYQGICLQLLQAPPFIIHYSGDLKCAIQNFHPSEGDLESVKELQSLISHRKVWIASSIHKDEEEVILGAHNMLRQIHTNVITIIVPRKPQHGKDIALKFQEDGVYVALRSRGNELAPQTSVYVVDSLGELKDLYKLAPVAVIGGSFFPQHTGHNILEAAAAGCAVLTGHHVGHFSHMVSEMQRVNPLSVLQVSGENLVEAISKLFDDAKILEARRSAAKQACHTLSGGIIDDVWKMLDLHIFKNLVVDDTREKDRNS